MKTKMLFAIVILIAFVIGLGVGIFAAPFILFRTNSNSPSFRNTHLNVNVTGRLFSASQYASSAYLISGNTTLSPSGQIATSDFNITTKHLENNSITYSLTFSELGTVYNVTIGPTEKLYYIDTNLADDVHGSDLSLGDDGYAIVNSTGYVVALKYPLPDT